MVTNGISDGVAGKALDNIEVQYYNRAKDPDRQSPVQFVNIDMKRLNKELDEGWYFYTQIKQEGVMLYDSGKFKLTRRRKLNFDEIKQQAQEYFDEEFRKANLFLSNAIHIVN